MEALKKLEDYENVHRKPLFEQIKKVEAHIKKHEENFQKALNDYKKLENSIIRYNTTLDNCDTTKMEQMNFLKDIRNRANDRKKQAELDQKQIKTMEEKINQLPSKEEAKKKLGELNQEKQKISAKREEIQRRRLELEDQKKEKTNQLGALQRKISQLNDKSLRRQQMLFAKQPHLKSVYEFIKSKKFEDEVYVPVLEIQIPNDSVADYIEHSLPSWYFNCVVTRSERDFRALTDFISQRNLKVTITRQSEDIPSVRPILNNFDLYGIDNYLLDMFEAPALVKSNMDSNAQMGRIIVTKQGVAADTLQLLKSQPGVEIFFANGFSYNQRRSRYSSSTSTSELRLRTSKLFRGTSQPNKQEEQQLQQELKRLGDELQEIEGHFGSARNQEGQISKGLQEVATQMDELNKVSRRRATMEQNLQQLRDNLQHLLHEEDTQESERRTHVEIQRLNSLALQTHGQVTTALVQMVELVERSSEIGLQKLDAARELRTLQQQQNSMGEELRGLKRVADECEQRYRTAAEETKRAKHEAEQKAPLNGQTRAIVTDTSLPEDVNALQVELEECQTKAQLSRSKNPNALLEYEARIKEIEECKVQQQIAASSRSELGETLSRTVQQWLPQLQKYVQRLNERFSHFLQLMGNAGEISLNTAEVGEDAFDKFALNIKVRFRNESSLENLNAKMQSGGERSVSTMLFLIAMQDVTLSPFRLVDEINQGMDPINERAIFRLVATHAIGAGKPQYFLVTPKLLSDLDFTRDMTILCILNGPWLDEDWDINGQLTKIENRH